MKLKDIGEFGLIEKIKQTTSIPDGVIGIGDDCAILPQDTLMETLVSTDMLVEGSHFLRSDVKPKQLGWKSAAVNISDIAAMGGKPLATFLSIALPPDLESEWIDDFISGYSECCTKYGATLLGGDTTSCEDKICINVTVLGTCPVGSAKLRSTAKVSDLICVTGNLGDSAGGLKAILEHRPRTEDCKRLIERHYHPVPRVVEGLKLSKLEGIHAMMDISDGIASDLRHILKSSNVSAEIDLSKLPISDELKAVWPEDLYNLATSGGEDYELLFTIDPSIISSISIPFTVIGTILPNNDNNTIQWIGSDTVFMGFRHF